MMMMKMMIIEIIINRKKEIFKTLNDDDITRLFIRHVMSTTTVKV